MRNLYDLYIFLHIFIVIQPTQYIDLHHESGGPMAAKMALYKHRRDAEKSASMASASAPMASASKKNLEGEKKDVSPDMSDDDENMPTLDDEELAAAISLGFGNAEGG